MPFIPSEPDTLLYSSTIILLPSNTLYLLKSLRKHAT